MILKFSYCNAWHLEIGSRKELENTNAADFLFYSEMSEWSHFFIMQYNKQILIVMLYQCKEVKI